MLSYSPPPSHLSKPPHLTVLRGQKLLLSQIEYLRADRNYTHVYLTDGTRLILSKTLKYYQILLASHGFVRCHKSYLVNPAYIHTHTSHYLCLRSGVQVEVARRKRNKVAKPSNMGLSASVTEYPQNQKYYV